MSQVCKMCTFEHGPPRVSTSFSTCSPLALVPLPRTHTNAHPRSARTHKHTHTTNTSKTLHITGGADRHGRFTYYASTSSLATTTITLGKDINSKHHHHDVEVLPDLFLHVERVA
mmetsp:Transcript_24724/g.67418  ORF Transcript_24724/g.67418 Transcript_24724/m.67418 type:complete len:115 (-) Transcript_24724:53-397(-)